MSINHILYNIINLKWMKNKTVKKKETKQAVKKKKKPEY